MSVIMSAFISAVVTWISLYTISHLLTYPMILNPYVLGPLMVNWILGQVNSTLAVHIQRCWRRTLTELE